MNRRHFLQSSAFVTTAATLHAADGEIIVGHGALRYKVDKAWARLDLKKQPLGNCHSIRADKQGRVILFHTRAKAVIIFDREGKVIDSWGDQYPGAHGLQLVEEEGQTYLWLTDTNRHVVVKTDISGKVVQELPFPEGANYPNKGKYKPTAIAVAPNGDLYVCDGYGMQFVHIYGKDGAYKSSFGGRGKGPGQFNTCHGIAVTERSGKHELIVADRDNYRVQRLNMDGSHIQTQDLPGGRCCDVEVHGDYIYLPNLNEQCCILNQDLEVVSVLGGPAPIYLDGTLKPMVGDGLFIHPHGITVDSEGDIYVSEWNAKGRPPYKLSKV
jgi:peptidylamidoglycolate lyase